MRLGWTERWNPLRMYLLDSNVIIRVLRRDSPVTALLNRLAEAGDLSISVLTAFEVLSGMRPHEQAPTAALLNSMEHIGVDNRIASLAAEFWQRYRRQGRELGRFDALIAATALVSDKTLVTFNVRDYPMPELKVLGRGLHEIR